MTNQKFPKKVFAHHMGSLNVGHGAMPYYLRNPTLGDPSVSVGGSYRNLAYAPYDLNLTLEESADLQIRRAIRVGIDGFAVNAWAGGQNAKEFLDALFKVAEEKDYPFEISICPDPNTLDQSAGFTMANVDAIKYLLDRHGSSPKLARRDGKPIIFGYQTNFIWVEYLWRRFENAELVAKARVTPAGWELVKEAFGQIESLVGTKLYFQFDMGTFFYGVDAPANGHRDAARIIGKHIPALCDFLPSQHTPIYAQVCNELGIDWGEPIYMNYDNNNTGYSHGGPGTDTLRKTWGNARSNNSTLLQLTTWNDYHENTNISPGVNTRYSLFDLTKYFIDWWKDGGEKTPKKDKLYIFSRKYPTGAKVFPFQGGGDFEGVIEILTILKTPARIKVPNRGEYDAPAGLHYRQFPVVAGNVSAQVVRGNAVILEVICPEPVSDKPFRKDNGIVGMSSEFNHHWKLDFGNMTPFIYSEYGDNDNNGLPNWFEMFWFGELWDFTTATGVDPKADPNSDGYSNLESFQMQISPIGANGALFPRRPWNNIPATIPGRIEAEKYDEGGLNVAYYDTTLTNQGGHFRLEENVDIARTSDSGSEYSVEYIESGEWIEYTLNILTAGVYSVDARVASIYDVGRMRLLIDGKDVSGEIKIPNTGGWANWTTITVPVTIPSGNRVLRVFMDRGGFNLNFLEFTTVKATEEVPEPKPITPPVKEPEPKPTDPAPVIVVNPVEKDVVDTTVDKVDVPTKPKGRSKKIIIPVVAVIVILIIFLIISTK